MDKYLINFCRKYYDLPDHISDEEVDLICSGSFGADIGRLELAKKEFKTAFVSILPKWIRQLIGEK